MSTPSKRSGHVSTPGGLGLSSPAPRSVPSPAATRKDQAGKTPVNHPTVGSTGSKTLGGTPMMPNLSQTGATSSSSPGVHGMSFGTPLAGLGVDLGSATPGQLNIPTPLAGAAMMPTLSELGLSVSGGKRNEDEERRLKLRTVLKSIGRPKGRISEESITRLSHRLGLQTDLDDEYRKKPREKLDIVGNRLIAIAGKTILIDVHMKRHVAQSVSVSFLAEAKTLQEQGEAAGQVLLEDLKPARGSTVLQTKLDRFAANLNDLARMDKLSSEKMNCFEAISGLYTSLRRLHEVEKEAVKVLQDVSGPDKEQRAETEVLRKYSGRPTIHQRRRIGMTLDYWVSSAREPSNSHDDAMDIDTVSPSPNDDAPQPEIFSLRIDTEHSPAAIFPAIRISDAWLPETFELPIPGSEGGIPWLDPPPTFVETGIANNQADPMSLDNAASKLPEIHFVAKLDPPVVMPYQVVVNILSILGVPAPRFEYISYHATLLDWGPQDIHKTTTECKQRVLSYKDGQEVDLTHRYMLDVSKPDYGIKLEEVPFSHPRQLVELLPTLRQWAHVGALIKNVFHQSPSSDLSIQSSLQDFTLSTTLEQPKDSDVEVIVGLTTAPLPSISLSFNEGDFTRTKSVLAQVLPNAPINILGSDFPGSRWDSNEEALSTVEKKLGRALELCGDLSVWVEWMRQLAA